MCQKISLSRAYTDVIFDFGEKKNTSFFQKTPQCYNVILNVIAKWAENVLWCKICDYLVCKVQIRLISRFSNLIHPLFIIVSDLQIS